MAPSSESVRSAIVLIGRTGGRTAPAATLSRVTKPELGINQFRRGTRYTVSPSPSRWSRHPSRVPVDGQPRSHAARFPPMDPMRDVYRVVLFAIYMRENRKPVVVVAVVRDVPRHMCAFEKRTDRVLWFLCGEALMRHFVLVVPLFLLSKSRAEEAERQPAVVECDDWNSTPSGFFVCLPLSVPGSSALYSLHPEAARNLCTGVTRGSSINATSAGVQTQ